MKVSLVAYWAKTGDKRQDIIGDNVVRTEIVPGITVDIPKIYDEYGKIGNNMFRARTHDESGKFNSKTGSSLQIAAYRQSLPSKQLVRPIKTKTMSYLSTDKDQVDYEIGKDLYETSHNKYYLDKNMVNKYDHYNIILQDDASGYFYRKITEINGVPEWSSMHYVGRVGNDEIGQFYLMIYVEQPVNGILDYDSFLRMIKSMRINGKNYSNNVDHTIVYDKKIP